MTDVISAYQAAMEADRLKIESERAVKLEAIKQTIKADYEKAKGELLRLRQSIKDASSFLQKVSALPFTPQAFELIGPVMREIASVIESGDSMVVAGITSYERLSLSEVERRPSVVMVIRDQLNNWDGKASFLAQKQGEIERLLRELASLNQTQAQSIMASTPQPEPLVTKVETQFNV